jgi:pyruvate/2-oxoglutarate dehydrogenase complex dihydrolipoamide acyltransferase (E2) component
MIEIKLPDTAWDGVQDGAEALLDKWLVAENVLVKKGQILVTVVLVKAAMDIEAPDDGRIEKILVKDGQSFISGAVLARFVSPN